MTPERAALQAIANLHRLVRIKPHAWDWFYAYDCCAICGGKSYPCATRSLCEAIWAMSPKEDPHAEST